MATREALDRVWPEARKHLLPAIEATLGTHDVNDVYQGIFEGRYQLWVGDRSAGVTQVVVYPAVKAIQVFLAGGDLDEIRHAATVLEDGARQLGFDRVEFGGRRGFVKSLPGYTEISTYMIKDL